MMMPGRSYSAGNQYRYGFNGKENDNEVKGEGSQQDYGKRIYDPRLGRFLSVDPLTKSYPMLTPYQFASNNPIEAIDLDGLEYLSSSEARIEVVMGRVKLKVENMTRVVRNSINEYINDPKNWVPGQIGVDLSIGNINFPGLVIPQLKLHPSSEPDPADANTPKTGPQGETAVVNPTAQSTNLPDKRYKTRTVEPATPGGSRGFAIAAVATEAIIYGANLYINNRIGKDKALINQHAMKAAFATADVNYALKNTNLIPDTYQTEQYLSDIIDIVLSGESIVSKSDPATGAKLLEIGKQIYSTLSIKRVQYNGTKTLRGPSDQVLGTILIPNPQYDPTYVKENTPPPEKEKK
ncbi:MAG: RHS repeat-associated core domain-containing protein [Chitinophagaceae bacterium]